LVPWDPSALERMTGTTQRVVARIYGRFRVGIHRWQLKHVIWYLTVELAPAAPATRYEHWCAITAVLRAKGREDLVERLSRMRNANYLRPTGTAGEVSIGGRCTNLIGR
jgi:hypothetical protein